MVAEKNPKIKKASSWTTKKPRTPHGRVHGRMMILSERLSEKAYAAVRSQNRHAARWLWPSWPGPVRIARMAGA